jgi:SAM-dependent methyltransferase
MALKENNIERMEKAVSLLERVDNSYVVSRVNQLCGDLFRRNKKFKRAASFYSTSNLARPDGNKAALYGLVECFRETKERDNFFEALDVYISHSDLPPIQIARCAVASAEFDDVRKTREICAIIEDTSDLDAPSCIALALSFAMIGDEDKKLIFSQKARELARDDKKLLLDISSIDYHAAEYWEVRYSGPQGKKAGVATSSHSVTAYAERLSRDTTFLNAVFEKHFPEKRMSRTLDAGCGSGRLADFLMKWTTHLDGVDISRSAINFAKKENSNNDNIKFETRDLLEIDSNEAKYDLILDFNTLQTFPNDQEWENAFRKYSDLCEEGGYLVLVEADGSKARKTKINISRKSAEDYISCAKNLGLELINQSKADWGENLFIFKR